MTTPTTNGKQKFWIALVWAVLVAALNAIVAVLNANPAYAMWGSVVGAVAAAISVYFVKNSPYYQP